MNECENCKKLNSIICELEREIRSLKGSVSYYKADPQTENERKKIQEMRDKYNDDWSSC